jgi:rubrerythrin
MKCEQCGIEFEAKINTDARFHDDKCRMDYHNKKRQLRNLCENVLKSVAKLKKALHAEDNHSSTAMSALYEIIDAAKVDRIPLWVCKCCGQETFISPYLTGNCHFCGKNDWFIQVVENN